MTSMGDWFTKLFGRLSSPRAPRIMPQQLTDAIIAAPDNAAFLELMLPLGAATSEGIRRRFDTIAAAHKTSMLKTPYSEVRERYHEHSSQVQRMYVTALFLDERQPLRETLSADYQLACELRQACMDGNSLTEVPKVQEHELLQRQYQGMLAHAGTLAPDLGALLKQRLEHHFMPLGRLKRD